MLNEGDRHRKSYQNSPKRRKVSAKALEEGKCTGPRVGPDGKHTIWHGLTGDMLPMFCVNGCRKWSAGPPTGGWPEDE